MPTSPSWNPWLHSASPRVRPPDAADGVSDLNCHLHVCDAGSDWERRHLLFRDWLRHSPEDRRSYDLAKRELARRDWRTMNHYADAKSEVISAIMTRAEAWAAEAGWSPYSQ
jgi:GrpB-like predicted nucleotidyltransferase (UPF0157 family)